MKSIIFNILTCTFIACTLVTAAFTVNVINRNTASGKGEQNCDIMVVDTCPFEENIKVERAI